MKPEQLYLELKDVAVKLGIAVEEHNLRESGIRVRSGLCTVRGKPLFIMDKHKPISKKIKTLAAALSGLDHENVYMIPAVRELLAKYADGE